MSTNTTQDSKDIRGDNVRGVDKIKRYQWSEQKNRGDFAWVPKERLSIDHSYQRDRLNEARISDMSSAWDWMMCGALSVAERDGNLFVMDGQHRKLAADKRSDITELPCMVFSLESKQNEAAGFVGLNSHKTAVSGGDRFKAMIVAGDETAIALNKLLQSTGHKVAATGGPDSVACIMCLWKLFRKDREKMSALWPLLADMSQGFPLVDCLVHGVFYAEGKIKERGESLTGLVLRKELLAAGAAVITSEIRREVTIAGVGGERIYTAAIMKWINRKRLGAKYKFSV